LGQAFNNPAKITENGLGKLGGCLEELTRIEELELNFHGNSCLTEWVLRGIFESMKRMKALWRVKMMLGGCMGLGKETKIKLKKELKELDIEVELEL